MKHKFLLWRVYVSPWKTTTKMIFEDE